MGKGAELHNHRVLNGLCSLVHTIVGTHPIENPHAEQTEQDQIIDLSLINPSKPFHPTDHIHPEPIVKEEVQVYVPPPQVFDNHLIIGFTFLNHPVVGILGYL